MFSKLFSLFHLKRKSSPTEETTANVDESNGRPTKRVRIEEPSPTKEDNAEQHPPVQANCAINEEEMEVLEMLSRGVKAKKVKKGEEKLQEAAVDAGLREDTPNRVEPDAQLDRLLWQTAMADARERGRRQMMEELRRDQERVHEQRRRRPCTRPRDESMGVVEERLRPVPAPSNATSSSPPSGIPLVSAPRLPRVLRGVGFGSQTLPPRPSIPIFVLPPPSRPDPSNSRATSPLPSPCFVDQSSNETILASLRQLRGQFHRAPSPQPSEGGVEELAEDDDESGDEDLPLFTAMMQTGNSPPNPDRHREYPVYEEDLDLPEDQPQVDAGVSGLHEELARIWALARRRAVLEDEDEETVEERLARLVREGEAEDGVDLE